MLGDKSKNNLQVKVSSWVDRRSGFMSTDHSTDMASLSLTDCRLLQELLSQICGFNWTSHVGFSGCLALHSKNVSLVVFIINLWSQFSKSHWKHNNRTTLFHFIYSTVHVWILLWNDLLPLCCILTSFSCRWELFAPWGFPSKCQNYKSSAGVTHSFRLWYIEMQRWLEELWVARMAMMLDGSCVQMKNVWISWEHNSSEGSSAEEI